MIRRFGLNKSRLLIATFLGVVTGLGNLFAQAPDTVWTRTYGGTGDERAYSVQQTQDGGYIIAGWTESFGAGLSDIYLVKTNVNGDTQWTRTFGGVDEEEGYSVQQTQDTGYIIAGYTYHEERFYDVYLVKTDARGIVQWTRTFGGDDDDGAYSVRQTQDGGYIIAGYTLSYCREGTSDVYLIKRDRLGRARWTKRFGDDEGDEGAYSVQQTQDGGYIIAGYTESFGAGLNDVYLIKTDASGRAQWTRTYGGTGDDEGYSVQQTQDGGYIIAGWTESFGAGLSDIYLVKTNANGDTQWTRTFGGEGEDVAYSVQQTQDGGYIIAGYTESFGARMSDLYLIKTDTLGRVQWTRTFGGEGEDQSYSVRETQDGGYIIAGFTESFGAGGSDVYLIRLGREVGIEEEKENLENEALSFDAYPNPFTRKTALHIRLSGSSRQPARIMIYNTLGRLVKALVSEPGNAEDWTIEWDGTDNNNEKLESGVYFVQVSAGPFIATRKVILR